MSKNLTPAEQSAANLADAKAKRDRIRHELDVAETVKAGLFTRLNTGDEDVSAADLAYADAGIERATLLLNAAERAVKRAQQALITETPTLAEALAGAIAPVFNGVPITIATAVPAKAPDKLPAVFVIQSKPSKQDTIEGSLSGTVELHYYRTPLHREADPKALLRTAEAAGIRFGLQPVESSREHGKATVDLVRFDVASAWEQVPVIASLQHWRAVHFARNVAQDVARSMQSADPYGNRSAGVKIGTGNASASRRDVDSKGELVSVSDANDSDANNLRTMTER